MPVYDGEGPGYCSAKYCRDISLQIVACNQAGTALIADYLTPIGPDGSPLPEQNSGLYCGDGFRNSGRCKSSVLCCSAAGFCDNTAEACATKAESWSYLGWAKGTWVQNGFDGSEPCGNDRIGNGRCETTEMDYGTKCCGADGECTSFFCNGLLLTGDGDGGYSFKTFPCSCSNGIGGMGTLGCTVCKTCDAGFTLTSYNTCK